MFPSECFPSRRSFLKTSAALATGFSGLPLLGQPPDSQESDTIVGPRKGYSPEIGTALFDDGIHTFQVLMSTKGLAQPDLDFLLDDNANRIGALLLHLVAIETFFQLNTFDGVKWDAWPDSVKQEWDVPDGLGEPARKNHQG